MYPNPIALFDSIERVMFGSTPNGELTAEPGEIGNQGHWPMRYRSGHILWRSRISRHALPEMSTKDITRRLAIVTATDLHPGA